MTIADPWNLDPTSPISNSSFNSVFVGENMSPALVNNGMRQLASFLAQATSYKSADLSTSVSTNIAATGTGLYMDLTGANAVNHFGSPAGAEQPNAAVFRFLQYDSSASVSHGANIKLIGSVSRRMQPGDVSGVIHEGSGVWREFCFARADGNLPMDSLSVTTITNRSMSTSAISTVTLNAASASISSILLASINSNSISASVGEFTLLSASGRPAIVFHGVASNASFTSISSTVGTPFDNTIPQITEGVEILSLTVTPTNAASLLRINAKAPFGSGNAGNVATLSLFIDSTAGALDASPATVGAVDTMQTAVLEHFVSASNTTQRVYHVRLGPQTGTITLNGIDSGRIYGGVSRARLSVEEILP